MHTGISPKSIAVSVHDEQDLFDLTTYLAKGGCSCKLPADELSQICSIEAVRSARPELHVDDDASIVSIGDGLSLVSSVDFQNPVLPDAYLSGRIAANNALSDIFACGLSPQWAEVILAVPAAGRSEQIEIGRAIMAGVSNACVEVGCKVVGGHSIVLPTPLIGLAVRAIGPDARIKRKSGAAPGDVILLTKQLGTGIMIAASQVGFMTPTMWSATRTLLLQANSVGAVLGAHGEVTAMTDVTGFGLLGHACEMANVGGVSFNIDFDRLPLLAGALRAAAEELAPELAANNWTHVESDVRFAANVSDAERTLLCDPQTNGGLLFAVKPEFVAEAQRLCAAIGQPATVIGKIASRATHLVTISKGAQQ